MAAVCVPHIYLGTGMGLMIILNHYSERFANLLGTNPVSVLATCTLPPLICKDSVHIDHCMYLPLLTFNIMIHTNIKTIVPKECGGTV